jgi:hypothetical protein
MTLPNMDLGPWPHPPWTFDPYHAFEHSTMITFHHGPSIVVMPQDHPPCSPSTMTPSTMDLPSWSCLRTIHHAHLPP